MAVIIKRQDTRNYIPSTGNIEPPKKYSYQKIGDESHEDFVSNYQCTGNTEVTTVTWAFWNACSWVDLS